MFSSSRVCLVLFCDLYFFAEISYSFIRGKHVFFNTL